MAKNACGGPGDRCCLTVPGLAYMGDHLTKTPILAVCTPDITRPYPCPRVHFKGIRGDEYIYKSQPAANEYCSWGCLRRTCDECANKFVFRLHPTKRQPGGESPARWDPPVLYHHAVGAASCANGGDYCDAVNNYFAITDEIRARLDHADDLARQLALERGADGAIPAEILHYALYLAILRRRPDVVEHLLVCEDCEGLDPTASNCNMLRLALDYEAVDPFQPPAKNVGPWHAQNRHSRFSQGDRNRVSPVDLILQLLAEDDRVRADLAQPRHEELVGELERRGIEL